MVDRAGRWQIYRAGRWQIDRAGRRQIEVVVGRSSWQIELVDGR